MIGKMRFNVLFGLIGFVFTFLVSIGNNLLMTSLLRGLFGFILWFMLAFLIRWVLGVIFTQAPKPEEGSSTIPNNNEGLGNSFDVMTPDEDEELKDLLKPKPGQGSGDELGFKPLQPPKLVSTLNPEELAQAVRHLKEE